MTITYRSVKGSRLTNAEVDANFLTLASAVAACLPLVGGTLSGYLRQHASGARLFELGSTGAGTDLKYSRWQHQPDGTIYFGSVNDAQTAFQHFMSISPAGDFSMSGGLSATSFTGPLTGNVTGNVSGNSGTTSQRTFSNVRTDGLNRGSYGSISIAGSPGGFAGIDFTDVSGTLMVSGTISGVYRNNTTWDWYFTSGVLTVGSVPWARLTSIPAAVSALSGTNTGDQTNISGNAATATTATNLSGGSVSATTITASGVIKGNGGSKGFGAITTTTTSGTPTGGSAGDFVFVY